MGQVLLLKFKPFAVVEIECCNDCLHDELQKDVTFSHALYLDEENSSCEVLAIGDVVESILGKCRFADAAKAKHWYYLVALIAPEDMSKQFGHVLFPESEL